MNDTKTKTAPKRKPGRPSAEERLRARLEAVQPLERCPTNEQIARAFNALLAALRGE